jgi:ParB family chromosome partitioning protein
MLEMALVENIQREDLNAIEVALSYQRLIEECKLTQEMLSDRVGKNRATIANYLRLLKLPAEIQLGLRENRLTMGHARALITVEDPQILMKIYHKIIHEDLSVRKTEALVKKLTELPATEEQPEEIPAAYHDLQEHLSRFFEIPVEFKRNSKGNGRIVLHFRNDEELEKIIATLDRLNR